jgi:hypothetical protein
MNQKKFKDLRVAVVEKYSDSDTKVEVKKSSGHFVVCINDLEVEYFRTKAAADDAAKDAIEAMEE